MDFDIFYFQYVENVKSMVVKNKYMKRIKGVSIPFVAIFIAILVLFITELFMPQQNHSTTVSSPSVESISANESILDNESISDNELSITPEPSREDSVSVKSFFLSRAGVLSILYILEIAVLTILCILFNKYKKTALNGTLKEYYLSREEALCQTIEGVYLKETSNSANLTPSTIHQIISKEQLNEIKETAQTRLTENKENSRIYQIVGSIILTLILSPLYKKIIEFRIDNIFSVYASNYQMKSIEIITLIIMLLAPIFFFAGIVISVMYIATIFPFRHYKELISDIDQIIFYMKNEEISDPTREIVINEKLFGKEILTQDIIIK